MTSKVGETRTAQAQGAAEQPHVSAQAETPAGPQNQSGAAKVGDDFVSKAARTAGQVVGGVREIIGPNVVDGAIEAAGRHKGKIAVAAGAFYAPGAALLAGVVAAGRTVQNGLDGKFAGKSLSEAVQYQADDFKGLKDGVVSEGRKTLGVLSRVFGFSGDEAGKADKKD